MPAVNISKTIGCIAMKFLQVQAMVNPNICYHDNKFSRHYNVIISKNVRSKKVKINVMIISGYSITMK